MNAVMNKPLLVLALLGLLLASCGRQRQEANSIERKHTYSSLDRPSPADKVFGARTISFQEADLAQVLDKYAEVSGRSLIRAGNLPAAKTTFCNQRPLSAVEVLRALDTVLAAQAITTVYLGTQFVKVVPDSKVAMEVGPVIDMPADQLPDSSSFITYVVKVKRFRASEFAPALMPFAKLPQNVMAVDPHSGPPSPSLGTLTNLLSIFGSKDTGILIFRDYSSNVRRMVQVMQKLEKQ
jgi:type II secretory pathway component GspD/PulD (secretin)